MAVSAKDTMVTDIFVGRVNPITKFWFVLCLGIAALVFPTP